MNFSIAFGIASSLIIWRMYKDTEDITNINLQPMYIYIIGMFIITILLIPLSIAGGLLI